MTPRRISHKSSFPQGNFPQDADSRGCPVSRPAHGLRRCIILGLTVLSPLMSCRESLPQNFDPIEGVYFNNTGNGRLTVDSLDYTFVYENQDVRSTVLPVTVQLLGRPADRDRDISFEVVSENAREGQDWSCGPAILRSGETSAEIRLSICRSQELKEAEKSVTVRLLENKDFILPFKSRQNAAGASVSAVEFTVSFSEMFTTAPQGWKSIFAGTFTQRKFELLCKVCGMDRILFNTQGAISDAKWMFMRLKVAEYVLTQENLRSVGETYDTDAFEPDGSPVDLNR